MNYLHVHFTDVSSFPVQSVAYPQLSKKGRISRLLWKSDDLDAVYTVADLKELVAYAAERSVRTTIPPAFNYEPLSHRHFMANHYPTGIS